MAYKESKDWLEGATGAFVTVERVVYGGSLQARKLATGTVKFYWRYTFQGKTERVVLGNYDPKSHPRSHTRTERGFSENAALKKCEELSLKHSEYLAIGGYKGYLATEKRAVLTAESEREAAKGLTLERLLDVYVAHLTRKRRPSARDAESIFRLHLPQSLKGTEAAAVTRGQITEALRALLDEDEERRAKGRTANKMRAYIRAAYQCGLDVEGDPTLPKEFLQFRLETNPAALTKRASAFDVADKDPFSIDELRMYWGLIRKMPGLKGAALRIHLLTGGQRLDQLMRLGRKDFFDGKIILVDGKGRPGRVPRKHVIPVVQRLERDFKAFEGAGPWLFSTDGGDTPLNSVTLSKWAKEIGAPHISRFKLKRVRSGVETALASRGVSREVRGYLQSHGLSGIQYKHYDDYDYLREKCAALDTLVQLLTERHPTQKSVTRNGKNSGSRGSSALSRQSKPK